MDTKILEIAGGQITKTMILGKNLIAPNLIAPLFFKCLWCDYFYVDLFVD